MAEPLKSQYGSEIPKTIAQRISKVYPGFLGTEFLNTVLDGYAELELMQRAKKITVGMREYLPGDYREAISILMNSLGERLTKTERNGMSTFLYLPHCMFVSDYGLNHFELSMSALYELTQRFTAEFSIRVFLETYPDETLNRLRQWAADPSEHVRRLVSEGTRPRLPWASRLPEFQKDPTRPLELLELLKDDESEYVRRSVANHLNDIGKDHKDILLFVATRWMKEATPKRKALVRHALRSLVKQGDSKALELLGYQNDLTISVTNCWVKPDFILLGESVCFGFDLHNQSPQPVRVMVDFVVHFQKANHKTNSKVFKLKATELPGKATVSFEKVVKFVTLTTRIHYPGLHRIEILVNGALYQVGEFTLKSMQPKY